MGYKGARTIITAENVRDSKIARYMDINIINNTYSMLWGDNSLVQVGQRK